jgi:hypothetical protein
MSYLKVRVWATARARKRGWPSVWASGVKGIIIFRVMFGFG